MTGVRRVGLALACALVAGGCGGSDGASRERSTAARPAPPGPFAYDRSAPLAYVDHGRVNGPSPIAVRDVSYAGGGGRVRAFLVLPPGRGPFPAVVYAHGSGEDRLAFVGAAAWIVARGAVAITVDQPPRDPVGAAGDPLAVLRQERDRTRRAVVDFRRTIDALAALPRVDERRIGFVGFSAGARLGAILAGVEPRIDAFVLMSGGASPVGAYVDALDPGTRAAAADLLGAVDPLRYVARARPRSLLIQAGRQDEIVPRPALEALAATASGPKEVRWYAAGHGLNVAALREQLDWLQRELRIAGPRVAGASTGPCPVDELPRIRHSRGQTQVFGPCPRLGRGEGA